MLKRIWGRAVTEIDLLGWRAKTAPIRNYPNPNPKTDKAVLFCNLMTVYATAKVEALFSAAFTQQGCRVVVLLPSKGWLIERLFSSTNKTEFIYLDEFLTQEIKNESKTIAKNLLASLTSLDQLINLEIDGFRNGRNALSCVVRKFRVGRIDPDNPKQMDELLSVIAESIAVSKVAKTILEQVKPELAVFLEKGYTPAGEVYDACLLNGVNIIQWFSAPQPTHLIFKRYCLENRDQHPFALGSDSWEKIKNLKWGKAQEDKILQQIYRHYQSGEWYNRQQLQTGKKFLSNQEVRLKLGVKEDRKIAIIFAHVLYDATFFYGDNLFQDYEQWLIETVRCAIANPELDWIVKVHPVNVWRSKMDGVPMEQLEAQILKMNFGDLPTHVRIMGADTEINTYSLFSVIDYGLTVRGTVGMELPCFGIPVVTAGSGRYSKHGFTIDPNSVDDYKLVLSRIHYEKPLNAVQKTNARKYAFASFFLRQIPQSSFWIDFEAPSFGVAALKLNVKMNSSEIEKWPHVKDLQSIVDWSLNSTDVDLLNTKE